MSARIDEYHGPEAKPLTTADVEMLQSHSDEFEHYPDVRLVDRGDLLATTRALETARAEIGRMEAESTIAGLVENHEIAAKIIRARRDERDAARATVYDLVTALEGLFVEYDYLCSEGSKYALRLGRVPHHACAECVPGGPMVEPGFRCREHSARAALAKAKEAMP